MSKTRFLRDCPPRNCKSGGGIPPGNEDSHTNIINHDKYVIPMETHQNTRFSIKTSLIMMNIYIYIYIYI